MESVQPDLGSFSKNCIAMALQKLARGKLIFDREWCQKMQSLEHSIPPPKKWIQLRWRVTGSVLSSVRVPEFPKSQKHGTDQPGKLCASFRWLPIIWHPFSWSFSLQNHILFKIRKTNTMAKSSIIFLALLVSLVSGFVPRQPVTVPLKTTATSTELQAAPTMVVYWTIKVRSSYSIPPFKW